MRTMRKENLTVLDQVQLHLTGDGWTGVDWRPVQGVLPVFTQCKLETGKGILVFAVLVQRQPPCEVLQEVVAGSGLNILRYF